MPSMDEEQMTVHRTFEEIRRMYRHRHYGVRTALGHCRELLEWKGCSGVVRNEVQAFIRELEEKIESRQ
jgi:hypothetical protein